MAEKTQQEIRDEAQYQDTALVLSKKKQPPAILRKLMNSFEAYRQARKYGWSRPWNKYDLINFQSFRLDMERDKALLETGRAVLAELQAQMPEAAAGFCDDLLASGSQLMGFVFCHEFTEGEDCYEGATLSLGRKCEKRYRDRIDIIVESPVVDGASLGFGRVRVYVDPYRSEDRAPLWQLTLPATELGSAANLFEALTDISWEWATIPERHWDHWTSTYIDYFGDRQWSMNRSYFWAPDNSRVGLDVKSAVA